MPKSFTPIPTSFEPDPEREDRFYDEIMVDAYGDEEKLISWYYYLEEVLTFPFEAQISVKKPKEDTAKSVLVTVESMADVNLCSIYNMWVQVQAKDSDLHFNVPMRDIVEAKAKRRTIEALTDWRYWIRNF
jgi:Calcium binding